MATVVLLGTLDTKGPECAYLRDRIRAAGCDVVLVDAGVMDASPFADIGADQVAAAGGADRAILAAAGDRGPAVQAMARGAEEVVDLPGRPFHDPVADAALIRELRAGPRPDIELVEMEADINDPAFARAMAGRLDEPYRSWVTPTLAASAAGGA